MHAGHVRHIALGLGVAAAFGVVIAWSQGASGQGVPSWAPKVGDSVTTSDGGVDGGNVVHVMASFHARDAGPKRNFFKDTLEYVVGFDPFERSPEELARMAARDGGMTVLDASVPGSAADAGPGGS